MITPEQLAKSGTEHGEQAALFCWAQLNLAQYPVLKWLHSSSNGIFTTAGHKAKERAAGLKKGVWDIFLPKPIHDWFGRPFYCGLYIEMKKADKRNSKNGGLTVEQEAFRNELQEFYKFVVCYSWEDARDAIVNYLGEGK